MHSKVVFIGLFLFLKKPSIYYGFHSLGPTITYEMLNCSIEADPNDNIFNSVKQHCSEKDVSISSKKLHLRRFI